VIALGVDTLCWHVPLERGETTVEAILEDARALGCGSVQLNLHHVRGRPVTELVRLRERADGLGIRLLASGDFLGQARHGDVAAVGRARVEHWLERAVAIGSPLLRVASGFYRAELFGRPQAIESERRYVVEVLAAAAPDAEAAGVRLLLENHSDFTLREYRSIVAELANEPVGVFLDVINPVAALDDPLPVIRELAPLAPAGHVKDYAFHSIPVDDGYHRRGFEVRYCYPGEGVAPLEDLVGALQAAVGERPFVLSVEGLDSHAGVHDQLDRLVPSLALLRKLVGASG